ncbi:hypothetical protein ETB97_008994 [Aspergillus alliaceus]|uniref:Uncharacterized protein n=1 Tax=Petromyces alliaceus TaxID=209559 RepID=A0A8H6E0Y0_PETAA|nr:hypothetical protein ETB97_008994 [Aspergillus burnettii]
MSIQIIHMFIILPYLVLISNGLPEPCHLIDPFKNNNVETVINKFDYQVCQKGCTPTFSQFNKWGKESLVDPIVNSMIEKMGLPIVPSITHDITNHIANEIRDACLGTMKEQNICEGKMLDIFGQCLKENIVPVTLSQVEPYSAFITEEMCKKAKQYVEGEELWTRVIPGAFDEYAARCKIP